MALAGLTTVAGMAASESSKAACHGHWEEGETLEVVYLLLVEEVYLLLRDAGGARRLHELAGDGEVCDNPNGGVKNWREKSSGAFFPS
uniref:Uncharacterized protein n=1 Tax=Oryza brachyantha TaxID=4533 RepID=J3M614_ORYBR